MKLRVFVTPQKHVITPELAALVQAWENGGVAGLNGPDTECTLTTEVVAPDSAVAPAELENAARDFTASLALINRAPVALRCEFGASSAPGVSGATRSVPASPPAAFEDLDEATLREALARLMTPSVNRSGPADGRGRPGAVAESGTGVAVRRLQEAGNEKLVALAPERTARFFTLDATRGARIALVERLRALVCAGAAPVAVHARLAVPSSLTLSGLTALSAALRAVMEVCATFDVALLGTPLQAAGPDEFLPYPRMSVSAVGIVADERNLTCAVVQAEGDNLVLLGEAPHELGGSHFLEVMHGLNSGAAPEIDLPAEKRLNKTLLALIRGGVLAAARHLAAGGLLVATGEMLLAPTRVFGARLDVTPLGGARSDALLFGESQGRVLVAVAAGRVGTVLSEAQIRGVPAVLIGEVTAGPMLSLKTRSLATEWKVAELRAPPVAAQPDAG